MVRFALAEGLQAKFRVTHGGVYHWSAVVATPAPVTLNIPGDTVVTVAKGGQPMAGLTVYAFDAAGTYLNYARVTDTAGVTTFALPVGQQVKFRVTDTGAYHWSAVAVAPATVALAVPANTAVTVTKGGQPLIGLTVYAFDAADNYLNYAMATNAAGVAEFALAEGQQVRFRVTNGSVYHWSPVAAAPANLSLAVPADTTVTLTKAGVPLAGVAVYAFDAAGTYLNYCLTTDAAGVARFALAEGLQVKFRVTDEGTYQWSPVITTPTAVDFGLGTPTDTTPPQIDITGVSDGLLTAVPVTPQVKVSDPNLATSEITLNGAAFASGTTLSADGDYTLAVSARDQAGNQAAASLQFSIDATPPEITVYGVEDGLLTNTELVPEIFVTDAHPGETVITLNGQSFASGTPVAVEGQHSLAVSAVDMLGNMASPVLLGFTQDFTPPVASALTPADGRQIAESQPVVSAQMEDALSGVPQDSVSLELDGEDVTAAATIGPGSISFTPPGALEPGPHTLLLMFTDGAGNLGWAQWAFEVIEPPVILLPPESVTVLEDAAATFSVTAAGTEPLSYQWLRDGLPVSDANSPTYTTVATVLADDGASYSCTVANAAGEVTSDAAALHVEPRLPIVTEITPAFGSTEGGDWIDIIGDRFVSDTQVFFGETPAQEVKFYNSGKLCVITPPAVQPGIVGVTVRTRQDRETVVPGAFEYLEPMVLTLDGFEDGGVYYRNTNIALTGTVTGGKGPYTLEVTTYSAPQTTLIPIAGGTVSGSIALEEGFHYVFCWLSDALGNVTWISFYYSKDITAPAAPSRMDAWADSAGKGRLSAFWPASLDIDTVSYEVTVVRNGVPPVASTQAAQALNRFDISGLTPCEPVTVSVSAIDRAGNKGQTASKATVAPPPDFYAFHDAKKKIEEQSLALDRRLTGTLWLDLFSTLAELDQCRDQLVAFDSRTVTCDATMSVRLSMRSGGSTGGPFADTSWPILRIPGASGWETVQDYVTPGAWNQVKTLADTLAPWRAAVAGTDYSLTPTPTLRKQYFYCQSSTSWADALSHILISEMDDPFITPTLPGAFGLAATGMYMLDGFMGPGSQWYLDFMSENWQPTYHVSFADTSGVSRFFWVDYGIAAPGTTADKTFPFGTPSTDPQSWPDPRPGAPVPGVGYASTYYDQGQVTANIYAEISPRPLTKQAVRIHADKLVAAPGVILAAVGEAIALDASVLYSNTGWGGHMRNNAYDDGEPFQDLNHDGLWDSSEPFTDTDTAYVSIPTTVSCSSGNAADAFICNQGGPGGCENGGSLFVGLKPGTYTIETPQTALAPAGGTLTVHVGSVNVELTDTENITVYEQDEDLYGALLPKYDDNNQRMGTAVFRSDVPATLAGTYRITLGNSIELWRNGALWLAAGGVRTGVTYAELSPDFQVKCVQTADNTWIRFDYIPDGMVAATFHDEVKIGVVGMSITAVGAWTKNSPIVLTEFASNQTGDTFYVLLPPTFRNGLSAGIFDLKGLFAGGDDIRVEPLDVTATGPVSFVASADALTPQTLGVPGETKAVQEVRAALAATGSKVGYLLAKGAGHAALKVTGTVTTAKLPAAPGQPQPSTVKLDDTCTVWAIRQTLEIRLPKVIDENQRVVPNDPGSVTWENIDNDDNDTMFDNVDSDGVTDGDNELVHCQIKVEPHDLTEGYIVYSIDWGNALAWTTASKVTAMADTDQIPLASLTPDTTNNRRCVDLWLEGTTADTAIKQQSLNASYVLPDRLTSPLQTAFLTVVGVKSVTLHGRGNSLNNDDTLTEDPWCPAGLRVFPDARFDNGAPGPVRNQVTVSVDLTTTSPVPGLRLTAYLRALDVDDPTASNNEVDDETIADDNRAPARTGAFEGPTITLTSGAITVDAKQIVFAPTGTSASATFLTAMQPGDNYRLVAAFERSSLEANRLANNDFAQDVGTTQAERELNKQRIIATDIAGSMQTREIRGVERYASVPLSVWRFLHVERDKMKKPGAADNRVQTTLTAVVEDGRKVRVDAYLFDGSYDLEVPVPPGTPKYKGRFEKGWITVGTGSAAATTENLTGNGVFYVRREAGIAIPYTVSDAQGSFLFGGRVRVLSAGPTGGTILLGNSFVTAGPGCRLSIAGSAEMTITAYELNPLAGDYLATVAALVQIPVVLHDDDQEDDPVWSLAVDDAKPSLGFMAESDDPSVNKFAPAYIRPVHDGGGLVVETAGGPLYPFEQDNLPFEENTDAFAATVHWDSRSFNSEAFWVVYLQSAFQPDNKLQASDPPTNPTDGDPDSEADGAVPACSLLGQYGGAFVFREVLREHYTLTPDRDNMQNRAVAHETGHLLGLNHLSETVSNPAVHGLMDKSIDIPDSDARFVPYHLDILRSREKPHGGPLP